MINQLETAAPGADSLIPVAMGNAIGRRLLPVTTLMQSVFVSETSVSVAAPITGPFTVAAFPAIEGDNISVVLVGVSTP
jgi:hypothetical protein